METRIYDPARPMTRAAFGIREPDEGWPLAERGDVDLILVPAVCYDRRGYRLGFGGGYYDRYLAEKAPQAYRAALTFDGQVVPSVPMEAHDARVNLILTETRRIEPNK